MLLSECLTPGASLNERVSQMKDYHRFHLLGKRLYGFSPNRLNETAGSLFPRDIEGHGTHTAFTAAGAVVKDAGFYEFAQVKPEIRLLRLG
ncbi:hypothetical protein L1887_13070 [Cichorium endivia]|nr:hypothetical protein L1887_13070 [Cichorium endivia]